MFDRWLCKEQAGAPRKGRHFLLAISMFCGLCLFTLLTFDLLGLIMEVNVYPFPSGLVFGSHIPVMFKPVGIFRECFSVLLNECFKNKCDLFILGHNFVSFAVYPFGEEKTNPPDLVTPASSPFLQMQNLFFVFFFSQSPFG